MTEDSLYGCYSRNDRMMLDCIDKEDLSVNWTADLSELSLTGGVGVDRDGNVYLLETEEGQARLWKVETDGTVRDCGTLGLEDTERADELSMKGIDTDGEGNFYIWCEMIVPVQRKVENESQTSEVWHYEDRVYVKDPQMKTVYYEKIEDISGTQVLHVGMGQKELLSLW